MGMMGKHLIIGLACGLSTILFGLTPVAKIIELKSYDVLHIPKNYSSAPDGIVLVAIDESSFAELNLQWPWPRSLHGRLTEVLMEAGATAIGFDILFSEPSRPEEDRAFAEAINSAGNVVLAAELSVSESRHYEQQMLVEPLPLLKENARTGIVSVPLDTDYVVRRIPYRVSSEGLFSEALLMAAGKPVAPPPVNAHISYSSPPNSYQTVSFYQALEPARYLPRDIFRGKIVIVGKKTMTATDAEKGMADTFATPFLLSSSVKNRLMSGIEIHANIVYNLLKGEFVVPMGAAAQSMLVLLIGAISGLLQFRWRPVRSAVLTAAVVLVLGSAAFILFEYYAHWIPIFSCALPVGLSYMIVGADTYVRTERKKQQIKKAFSHYLSPSVLEAVLADPNRLTLGGARVEATILFSDIADFTTICEQHTPETISKMLNRYMTVMSKAIMLHSGTIDKFIGDAIMAFWGAPLPDPEHSLNACRAALSMRDRLAPLNRELNEEGLPELSFRIGISTGSVIAGNMGSEELFDYTVIGDAVNIASRLEGANKLFNTDILICHYVYENVKGRVDVLPLDRISVKGKADKVEVYKLIRVIEEKKPCF